MNTKHKDDCNMVFGRKDITCPRCQELLQGAKPRRGYGDRQIFSRGKLIWITPSQQSRIRTQEIRNHDCQKANCHPTVCTAFDY